MDILESLLEGFKALIPAGIAIAGFALLLFGFRYLMEKRSSRSEGHIVRRQMITILLSFVGLLVIILVSPMSENKQGQLLGLIGILLSAAIALSSTTFVGNAMAGLMLRAVHSFKIGDFIKIGDYFGRVSERGLFHIEIQTEDRDLITLPNLYLVTNPVRVVRSSGTIVWSEVSLGYDIPRKKIEKLLLEAARAAGLKEPFVYVMNLGDFSVVYRVSGMLEEVKQLLSTRSSLREMMLDSLHQGGIEIVSPTFMNTRPLTPDNVFIPIRTREDRDYDDNEQEGVLPENLVFDKAEQAESIEKLRERLDSLGHDIEQLKADISPAADDTQKEKLKEKIEFLKTRRERLAEYIKRREQEKK
nr:mechanosensitive ion channel [candidate division Zixibacteria bacterium]